MFKLNTETVFRRECDGTCILFNPDTGKMFTLNPTAQAVYKALMRCESESEIIVRLSQQASLPEDAAAQVSRFLTELRKYGFLQS